MVNQLFYVYSITFISLSSFQQNQDWYNMHFIGNNLELDVTNVCDISLEFLGDFKKLFHLGEILPAWGSNNCNC